MLSKSLLSLFSFLRKPPQHMPVDTFARELSKAEEIIKRAPLEKIKPRVEAFLEDPQRYRVNKSAPSPEEIEKLNALGPIAKDLFLKYESIYPIYCDTKYVRRNVGPSAYAPGFIRIATTVEFTEVVVSPKEDVVFEVDSEDECPDQTGSSPTVFHYLLLDEWLTKDDPEILHDL